MANEAEYGPQAQKAFRDWEHLVKKEAPRQVASLVRAGRQLRALSSTRRTKR